MSDTTTKLTITLVDESLDEDLVISVLLDFCYMRTVRGLLDKRSVEVEMFESNSYRLQQRVKTLGIQDRLVVEETTS